MAGSSRHLPNNASQKKKGLFWARVEPELSACAFTLLLLLICRVLFERAEAKGPRREAEHCPVETTARYLAVFFPGNSNKLEGMDYKVKIISLTSTKRSGATPCSDSVGHADVSLSLVLHNFKASLSENRFLWFGWFYILSVEENCKLLF